MRVYVVTQGEYSDYHIEAIFSKREEAEKYITLHGYLSYGYDSEWHSNMQIEEYELDNIKIEGEVEMVYTYERTFRYEKGGKRFVYIDYDKGCYKTTKVYAETYFEDYIDLTYGGTFRVTLKEKNDDKAEKIFQDKLAEANARLVDYDGYRFSEVPWGIEITTKA